MVEYFRISQGEPLPVLSAFRPFKAVIVIDEVYSDEWQNAVSKWLVESGCLYMMAWGEGCSSWDDAVDRANLEEFDYGKIPDDRFVMTTWHENEPLSEVLLFAQFAANAYSDVDLPHLLLIDVGPADRRRELMAQLQSAAQEG